MVRVSRALVSVTDKTGLPEFVRGLHEMGVEILSTGGTARLLEEEGIPVLSVGEYTGAEEIMGGRVKTLHPKVFGSLLALRDNPDHMQQLQDRGMRPIDLLVVNFYPFEKVAQQRGVRIAELLENIDIGGPAMLRSAAKNMRHVAAVCDPARYENVLQELQENGGSLSEKTVQDLAIQAFEATSNYDRFVWSTLKERAGTLTVPSNGLPGSALEIRAEKVLPLRYGENPHQAAALYAPAGETRSVLGAQLLHGKPLSYNNLLDLEAASNIANEFTRPAACVIKHGSPCGAAVGSRLSEVLAQAWAGDPLSAFGGIVGFNREVDLPTAEILLELGFIECIVAPGFRLKASKALQSKKNLRLVVYTPPKQAPPRIRSLGLGLLVQEADTGKLGRLRVVTRKKPTEAQLKSLKFAWTLAKHALSNAIVLVQKEAVVGVGAGQTSRVDAVRQAIKKAGDRAQGAVLASDGFFPMADGVTVAARAGIKAIIQPGGSVRDEQTTAAADKAKMAMVFTGMRHFRH
ncbi:MAG: bifunctional phosphoribosylaminoimidazolecarboxamide formyltransferase/IMP cyclohydrolase [Candidatus Omnitrophica bacterium]|nr:bifunctional phosphoribosylaminoimidazolecarboxamide formyltransferase/IMP cyclohydrolase [Candidatus Omnitrophota bacterium]